MTSLHEDINKLHKFVFFAAWWQHTLSYIDSLFFEGGGGAMMTSTFFSSSICSFFSCSFLFSPFLHHLLRPPPGALKERTCIRCQPFYSPLVHVQKWLWFRFLGGRRSSTIFSFSLTSLVCPHGKCCHHPCRKESRGRGGFSCYHRKKKR